MFRLALCAMCLFPAWAHGNQDWRQREGFDRFIVMFKPGSAARQDANARQRVLDAGARGAGSTARRLLRLAQGSDVVVLSRKLPAADAHAFMNRLRLDPSVQFVEIDRVIRHAVDLDDPLRFYQWNLADRYGGINAWPAWDLASAPGKRVAVLDTGMVAHTDLQFFGGYDFVSDLAMANDGNGRDNSPLDPGDWVAADACGPGSPASDSSWHGTLVAGIAAAKGNNGQGIIGIAYGATVQPIRVLGRCGGYVSDLADAITWAAGGTVPGIPVNTQAVTVINLSLNAPGACGATLQAAIDLAVAAGIPVVAAAGNTAEPAAATVPASCNNVIIVGASSRRGDMTTYSNYGDAVDVLAPGGDSGGLIPSTWVDSPTVYALKPIYALAAGTSMAAPQVAGVATLMKAAQPDLPPAAIEAMLKSTARPPPLPCPQGCGAGIINAAAAVGAAKGGALTVDDASMREGDEGSKGMLFKVRLSKPMPYPVTFDIASNIVFLDALPEDVDSISLTGQVIPAGQTSYDFWVPVRGDTAPEPNESFRVVVSNVVGIAVADGTAMGLIINDDPYVIRADEWSPSFMKQGLPPDDSWLGAGEYGLVKFEVPVGTTDLTVYSGMSGSCLGCGTDPDNDGDLYVRYGNEPTLVEADCIQQSVGLGETCHFANPQPGTWYAMLYAYSRVQFGALRFHALPEAVPRLSVGNESYFERDSGSQDLTFFVNFQTIPQTDVYVDVSTIPGTATPGIDYEPLDLKGYKIPAGTASSVAFKVKVYGDTQVEGNETFGLSLSNPVGVVLERPQAQFRILNDDKASLGVRSAQVMEGEGGARKIMLQAVLSQPMPNPVFFTLATTPGTATEGSDFVPIYEANLMIDAGRTRKDFEVTLVGDSTPEADEDFYVAASSYQALWGGIGKVTIVNDDVAPSRVRTRSSPPPPAPAVEPASRDDGCRPAGARVTPANRRLATCKARAAR